MKTDHSFWKNYYTRLPVDLQGYILTKVRFSPPVPKFRKGEIVCMTGTIRRLLIMSHPTFDVHGRRWLYCLDNGTVFPTAVEYQLTGI